MNTEIFTGVTWYLVALLLGNNILLLLFLGAALLAFNKRKSLTDLEQETTEGKNEGLTIGEYVIAMAGVLGPEFEVEQSGGYGCVDTRVRVYVKEYSYLHGILGGFERNITLPDYRHFPYTLSMARKDAHEVRARLEKVLVTHGVNYRRKKHED